MKQILRLLIAFGWLSAALLTPFAARAEAATDYSVIISEVAWAGSEASNADEWIELANLTNDPVSIAGWSLTGAASGGDSLTIPDGAVIQPNSTYLIANYDADHEKSTLAIQAELVTTSLSLSNSALGISLQDESATTLDSAGVGSAPPAGSTGGDTGVYTAMTRIDLETWANAAESSGFDPGATELGTPGTFSALETLINDHNQYDPDQTDPSEADADSGTADETESTQTDPESAAETTDSTSPTYLDPTYPNGTLIINEFVSDPSQDDEEWIEIYNPYNNVIPLAGWVITEAGGSSTTLPDQPLGYDQFILLKPIKGNLNNSGDTITLLDPSGNIIDQVSYGDSAEAPAESDPNSVARDANGAWQATTTPTPREQNIITLEAEEVTVAPVEIPELTTNQAADPPEEIATEPTEPIVYDLRLNEVYPNTEGDDETEEFVEVINTGESSINPDGWTIEDASGKQYLIEADSSLNPGAILAIERTESKIALNNSGGEAVTLIAPDGNKIDQLKYEKTRSGYSLILFNGQWSWTTVPTKAQPNVLSSEKEIEPVVASNLEIILTSATAPDPPSSSTTRTSSARKTSSYQTVELAKIRNLPTGTKVSTTGTISAEPGVLGKQIMYLAGSGVQAYLYYANWPELTLGDSVSLKGELSTSRGETRLKLASAEDITVIESSETPEPHQIAISELGLEHEGWLVMLEGSIVQKETDRMVIEETGSELLVVIKESTGLNLERFTVGERIAVTGIVSRYYDELRLLPRYPEDLALLEESPAIVTGSTSKDEQGGRLAGYAYAIGALTLITLAGLYVYRQRNKNQTEHKVQTVNYSPTN